MNANKTKLAIIGAGFWANYQVAAWMEQANCECIAIVDRDEARARRLADRFGIPKTYSDAETMFRESRPELVDIITTVESHEPLVKMAARYGCGAICQKPFADDLDTARGMLAVIDQAKLYFAIHENWRWQKPIREVKAALDSAAIGEVFRGRIDYCNSFPVFDNQPNLKQLSRFILADMGSHIFDVARFLFGEFDSLACMTYRTRPDIVGEDVASVFMSAHSGCSVQCNLSYASRVQHDRFPETFIFIEGTNGSIELDGDYWLSVTTEAGTVRRRIVPDFYTWVDRRYEVVHSSMVACIDNLLTSFRDGRPAETSAADNLKTMEIIEAAYAAAASKQFVALHS
jgi:predicted dehydrogenase